MLRTIMPEQLPSNEPGVEQECAKILLHQADAEEKALERSLLQQQVAVAIIMTATGTSREAIEALR